MFDRLTFPWALLSAVLTSSVGLWINLTVESRWIAPAAMFLMLVGLLVYGRIPNRHHRRDQDEH